MQHTVGRLVVIPSCIGNLFPVFWLVLFSVASYKWQYVTFSVMNCGQLWVWPIDVVSSLISLHSVTPLINCWDYLTRDWQVTAGAPAVPLSFHVTQFQDLTYFFANSKLKVLGVTTKKLEDAKITEFWLPRILLAREKKKLIRAYIFQAALEVMWLPTQILYVFCTMFREGIVKWHTGQTGPRSQEVSQIIWHEITNSVWTALGWNASVSQVSPQCFEWLAQQFAATRLYFWVQSLSTACFLCFHRVELL